MAGWGGGFGFSLNSNVRVLIALHFFNLMNLGWSLRVRKGTREFLFVEFPARRFAYRAPKTWIKIVAKQLLSIDIELNMT